MKNVKLICCLLAFCTLGLSSYGQAKIAIVDLRKVFDDYYKTKAADNTLKDRAGDLEKERKALTDQYQKLTEDYKKALDGANDQAVSSDEREKRKKTAESKLLEIKELEQNLTQFDRQSRTTLEEQQRRMRENILSDALPAALVGRSSKQVKQLQIVAVTLLLMLQFIWLIFRGNLGTLRMLAEGANRFSQGDHAVRIDPEGAPEVGLAAEAFNNMANNIESLIASLGKSESKNKLLATIVEQSSEAIWTRDLGGIITSWNSGAAAMFGYPPAEALGHALNVGGSTPEDEEARGQRLVAGEKFS